MAVIKSCIIYESHECVCMCISGCTMSRPVSVVMTPTYNTYKCCERKSVNFGRARLSCYQRWNSRKGHLYFCSKGRQRVSGADREKWISFCWRYGIFLMFSLVKFINFYCFYIFLGKLKTGWKHDNSKKLGNYEIS